MACHLRTTKSLALAGQLVAGKDLMAAFPDFGSCLHSFTRSLSAGEMLVISKSLMGAFPDLVCVPLLLFLAFVVVVVVVLKLLEGGRGCLMSPSLAGASGLSFDSLFLSPIILR